MIMHASFPSENKPLTVIQGPVLLGADNHHLSASSEKQASWRALPPHKDEEQVKLDVNRSFVYYPSGEHAARLMMMCFTDRELLQANRNSSSTDGNESFRI